MDKPEVVIIEDSDDDEEQCERAGIEQRACSAREQELSRELAATKEEVNKLRKEKVWEGQERQERQEQCKVLEEELRLSKSRSAQVEASSAKLDEKVKALQGRLEAMTAQFEVLERQKSQAFDDGVREAAKERAKERAREKEQAAKRAQAMDEERAREKEQAAIKAQEREMDIARRDSSIAIKDEELLLLRKTLESKGKETEQQSKEHQEVLRRTEVSVKQLNNKLRASENENSRLQAALKEKGEQVITFSRQVKDRDVKVKELEAALKKERELNAELKADVVSRGALVSQLKGQVKKFQTSGHLRSGSDFNAAPAAPRRDQLGSQRVSDAREKAPGEESSPHTSAVSSNRNLQPNWAGFGCCYFFGRGEPSKAQKQDRPVDALPYDDAFGATSTCMVLGDGVGGGGADSGCWARSCVNAVLKASCQPVPKVNGVNVAGEIVTYAYKNMENDSRNLYCQAFPHKQATTTLLALKLLRHTDERGVQRLRIDACEIGDSRWAYVTWDATTKKYAVQYLAEAHMHEESMSLPPFQIKPPGQIFGTRPEFYFQKHKRTVLSSLPISLPGTTGKNDAFIVAGSDGLWDNLLKGTPGNVVATTSALKEKLENITNEVYLHRGNVDNQFIEILGRQLKSQVVRQMATDKGKLDDVSIFIGKIETRRGVAGEDILESRFFDGSLPLEEVRNGKEVLTQQNAPKSGAALDVWDQNRGAGPKFSNEYLGKRKSFAVPQDPRLQPAKNAKLQ